MSDTKEDETQHWYEPRDRADIDIIVEGHTFHCHQLDLVRKSPFFNAFIEASKDQLKVVFPPLDLANPVLKSWKMTKSILDHIDCPDKWMKERCASYEELVKELTMVNAYLGIQDESFLSRYEKQCIEHQHNPFSADEIFWHMFSVTKSIPHMGIRGTLLKKLVHSKVFTSESLAWLQSAPATMDAADWKVIHGEMLEQEKLKTKNQRQQYPDPCCHASRRPPSPDSDSD